MAKRDWSVLAHLACRTGLSVSLSPIPVTGSPALSGLVLFLPCDNWHLSGLDGLSSLFRDTGLWQCAVYFRLLAPSLAMTLLSRTSCARAQLRCFSAPSGICPVMIVDLPWTHAKARAQTLDEYLRCSARCKEERSLVFHPRPGVCPMSGIMCSQGGHRIAGQMAKAFSSA